MSSVDRTAIRRHPERARDDRAQLDAVLDEAIVCHVGFQAEHGPVVIPMLCVRMDDELVIHGSPATGTIRALRNGAPACVTVTLIDGLVISRAAFGHSVNYRSAVLFGSFSEIPDGARKEAAARAVVERIVPGRWAETRAPTPDEMRRTSFLAMEIGEWSLKVRAGPPIDDDDDCARPVWAGEVPLSTVARDPVRDPLVDQAIPVPDSVRALTGTREPG